MKDIRLKILDLGDMTFCKKELIKTENMNELIISPALAILVQHPVMGNILYDTGNDDSWKDTYSSHIQEIYPVSRMVTIKEALEKEEMTPSDINLLIISHFHFDHVGGLKFFSGTTAGKKVIVPEPEARDAFYRVNLVSDGIDGAYIRKLFCGLAGVGFETINHETKLADGITLFLQSCHTTGVVGMRVELEHAGTILFCGDTIYTQESYDRELPPGGAINKTDDEFYANLKHIKAMRAQYDAQIFFGHDFEQAKKWLDKGWIC